MRCPRSSRPRLAAAGLITDRTGARLQVLHAESTEAPVYFTHEQVEALAAQRARMEAQAKSYVEAFVRRHTAAAFTVPEHRPA